MRICVILLALILPLHAESWRMQDGVIISKVGNSYIFVFPSTKGRITGIAEPAGKIKVGKTIAVVYALKIIGSGRARFIGFDATQAHTDPKPTLRVEEGYKTFGFAVKDANNPNLDIHMDPEFAKKVGASLRGEKVARQGNLYVTIGKDKDTLKIIRVDLN